MLLSLGGCHLQIPGTSSTIQPENYSCDSCNIVYMLICDKFDSEYYIGETSKKEHQGFSGGCTFQQTRTFAYKFEMCCSQMRLQNVGRQIHL